MGVFVRRLIIAVSTSLCSGNAEWRNKFLNIPGGNRCFKKCTGKLITSRSGNYDRTIPFDYQTTHVIEALNPLLKSWSHIKRDGT